MGSAANDEVPGPIEEEPSPWDTHVTIYQLKDARVVAILSEDGGAVVESHPILVVHEGRMETYGTDGKGQSTSSLDYGLAFGPKIDVIGNQHTGYEAKIVITGTAANGRIMEIRGTGFIGHDEHGQLDGIFHELPTIYVPSDEDLSAHVESLTDQWGGAPIGEWVMATYGRAQEWS